MIRKLILMGVGAAAFSLDITRDVAHKLVRRGGEAVAAMRHRLQEPEPGKIIAALPAEGESQAARRKGHTEAGTAQHVPIGGSEGDA